MSIDYKLFTFITCLHFIDSLFRKGLNKKIKNSTNFKSELEGIMNNILIIISSVNVKKRYIYYFYI